MRTYVLNRRLAIAISAILGPTVLFAQNLPDAATILERYVDVTGGRSAYESHNTEILTGVIEFPAQGLKGKLTRYAAPGREYSIVDLQGIGAIESGISGGVAWEKSVLLGPRIKQGEEKAQAMREGDFDAPIHWRTLYQKASTAGTQTINGDDCYEVALTPADGKPEHQFYSKKTGLLVRTTAIAASQMGDVEVEVNVSDYRSFGGVLMPTRSTQRAGSQELSITVDQVRVNESIPASRFELPADVSELLEKSGTRRAQ